jgi:hypothetical protein
MERCLIATQERIKELLNYDRKTGEFTWRYRSSARKEWNTRYAGQRAGWIWYSKHGPYWQIGIDEVKYYGHQIAWLYVYGFLPGYLDHKDKDGLNNRIRNLRICSNAQNMGNTSKHVDGSSGYKGVSWHKQAQKWHARIGFDYKSIHIGIFDTAEEAHQAYVAKAKELFGDSRALDTASTPPHTLKVGLRAVNMGRLPCNPSFQKVEGRQNGTSI